MPSYKQYKKQLSRIKKRIIIGTNNGEPKNWQNKDYEDLRFKIKQSTSVLISTSTLKRIFGKNKTDERYLPQQATYDALDKYAASFEIPIHNKINYRKALLFYALPAFIIFVVGFIFFKSQNDTTEPKINFIKLEGNNPSSAFFEYSIPNIKEHFFIDFGDGVGRKSEPLNPQNHKITHFYRYPGMFKTKIISENGVESEICDVLVPTNDWESLTYYYNIPHSKREFYSIQMNQAIKNGVFHPTSKYLTSIGINVKEPIMTQLANFTNTDTNGDSFNLKTRIKNVEFWPLMRCYMVYIEVVGTKGHILMMLATKGCSHWMTIDISEKHFEGNNSDLSNLIVDLENWKEVNLVNRNKNIEMLIDNKSVYKEKYNNSIGDIAGVSIIFLTNGFVDYVKLFDKNENLILGTDF